MRQAQREAEKELQYKQECTFRPQKLNKYKIAGLVESKENQIPKHEQLYASYKLKAQKLEHMRVLKEQEEMQLYNIKTNRSKSKSSKQLISSPSQQVITNIYQSKATPKTPRDLTASPNRPSNGGPSSQSRQKPQAFERLYQQAKNHEKKREDLKKVIEAELGINFSPKVYKSPKKVSSMIQNTTLQERN